MPSNTTLVYTKDSVDTVLLKFFFNRKPNSKPNSCTNTYDLLPPFINDENLRKEAIKDWRIKCKQVTADATKKQLKQQEKMVNRHKSNNPPSIYEVGEEVIVKITKSDKRIKKGKNAPLVIPAIITERKNNYNYRVKVEEPDGKSKIISLPVSHITSITRQQEIEKKRTAQKRKSEQLNYNAPDKITIEEKYQVNEQCKTIEQVFTRHYNFRNRSKVTRSIDVNGFSMRDMAVAIENSLLDSEQMRNLRNQLLERNLQLVDVLGDGNCFFRAISHQLFATEDHHQTIRENAINHMLLNPDMYSRCFDENQSMDEFIALNSKNREWADSIIISATSNFYQVNINIINDRGVELLIHPEGTSDHVSTYQTVIIGHIGQSHYTSSKINFPITPCSYGGSTRNVKLTHSCPLDGPLTWLMALIKSNDKIRELISTKVIIDVLNMFMNNKTADAKAYWFEQVAGKAFNRNLYGSEAELFFEPLQQTKLGNFSLIKRYNCEKCNNTLTKKHKTIRCAGIGTLENRINRFLNENEPITCSQCKQRMYEQKGERQTNFPPIIYLNAADYVENNNEIPFTLNIDSSSPMEYCLMLITVKQTFADHFVSWMRLNERHWFYFDGLRNPSLQWYERPSFQSIFGLVQFLVYVNLAFISKGFRKTTSALKKLKTQVEVTKNHSRDSDEDSSLNDAKRESLQKLPGDIIGGVKWMQKNRHKFEKSVSYPEVYYWSSEMIEDLNKKIKEYNDDPQKDPDSEIKKGLYASLEFKFGSIKDLMSFTAETGDDIVIFCSCDQDETD